MTTELKGQSGSPLPLVSIIMPVFDTAPYLEECLDSVCGQTHENLEIVIVDDGSTDGSSEICDEYACQDRRIKVVRQPNKGVSAARNAGLAVATGQYIAFVDGDDVIGLNHVEVLLTLQLHTQADIVISGSTRRSEDLDLTAPADVVVYTPTELLLSRHPLSPLASPSLCGKLYSREVLLGTHFPEGRVHEDAMLTHRIVQRARRVAVTTHSSYHYRVRSESITRASRRAGYFLDKARAHQIRVEDLEPLHDADLTSVEFSKALSSTLLAIDSLAQPGNEGDAQTAAETSSLTVWLWENRRHQRAGRSRMALYGLRWVPTTTARMYARTVPELRRRP